MCVSNNVLIAIITTIGIEITTAIKSNETKITDIENILFIGVPFTDETITLTSIT
jgi:hypothetical protein